MSSSEMKPLTLLSIFILLLLLLLLPQAFSEASSSFTSVSVDEKGNVVALDNKNHHRPKFNCNHACSRRCSKTSRKKVCLRACGACCSRCHCVPPGTYGNHHLCPCYARLRTHGNKPKCP